MARLPPLAAALLAAASPLRAQEPERPRAHSTPVAVPPVIDGRLDDPAWEQATPIGELTQVEPVAGAPPSERTDVRFVHDADHLYMMIRCYDSDPAGIVVTTRERDALLEVDDRVEIVFDTFLDRRNAFFFQINAAGSKGDALVTGNGANFNKPWDGIWDGAARIDELGWAAELALPFKTLAFAEGRETWGFNIERHIGRKREDARWATPSNDHRLFNVYRAGDLGGLTGIRQGIGLDVVPFFVTEWQNDRVGDDKTLLGEPGVDLFYKVIPSLTLSVTVNTDFAETEVDTRQVNLTRFPLFFPERRDFFLQDAGLFEFGLNAAGGGDRLLIPFFSRRIGLAPSGEEVPILAGAKLTGRAGPWGIGVLDVQTDDLDELDGENLFVGRLTRDFGAQSTLGGIVTHGNPAGGPDNAVYGLDVTHRADLLAGDRDLVTSAFFLQADTQGVAGDQSSYGLAVRAPGDLWSFEVGALEIQDDFQAALGFVPRPGVRRYEGGVDYEPRPDLDAVRQLSFGLSSVVFTDTGGELETWESTWRVFGAELETGDELVLAVDHVRDEPREDFEISDGVVVPAGEYDFTAGRAGLASAENRPLSASAELVAGEFFDGDRVGWELALRWQPGALFNGQVAYARNDVDLPGGSFETQLAQLRASVSFTPELSWSSFLQWDADSDTLGIQSRLRWIPEPRQEVYLVFEELLESDSSAAAPLFQELALKVAYALRF